MDTEVEIKQEDCFSDDLASQNERELIQKDITVKSNSNAVLPDDNGCDKAIKTEIKSETSFLERECFTKHFVKQIEFEDVTCRDNCEIASETKIEEEAADSDLSSQKGTEFLSEDPLMKTKNHNSDHDMHNKIEIKVEPWWLETETSDDIKDQDFPRVISSSSCTEALPGTSSGKSPLPAAKVSGRETSFYNGKDLLECEHQKVGITEMPSAEEYVLSEQSGNCSDSGEMYMGPLYLKQKGLINKGKRPHKCQTCDKSFAYLSNLNRHNLIHEGRKPHQCRICDKKFSQLSHLKRHNLIHEGNQPHQCKTCAKSFTLLSHLKRHNLTHEDNQPYQCKSCDKSFIQLSNLKAHNLIHEGNQPHQCKICHKSFIRLSHLKTHNLIHEDKKPHQCKICDKKFNQLSHLKRHNLVHEGNQPHQCKTCDKSFTQLSNLKRHNLIHEGNQPHQCTTCQKSFTRLSHLKTHNLIHEGKKPHQCKTCDKSFTQLSNLKRHNLIHKDKK